MPHPRPAHSRASSTHSYLLVGTGFSIGYWPEIFPCLPLKGGDMDVQVQLQPSRLIRRVVLTMAVPHSLEVSR